MIDITQPPPCQHCNACCCRQNGHDWAVTLEDEEMHKFSSVSEYSSKAEAFVLPYVDGKCVYLSEDDKCKIYDRRPIACQQFSCLSGYKAHQDGRHSFFLGDNPQVVDLIELHVLNVKN